VDESHERDEGLSQRPQAEGVRIIRAEEAQAALEAGQAAGRRPDDAPRFGDVPPPPSGPRSPHRFPLPDSVDPASAVPRPPVRPPERRFSSRLTRGKAAEPVRAPTPPRVVRLLPPTESVSGLDPASSAAEVVPEAGWEVDPHWSEATIPRSAAAEPVPVGAPTEGPKHFAKDPNAPLSAEWRGADRAAPTTSQYSGLFTSSLDPPPPAPPGGPGSQPPPVPPPLPPPDLALPEEGINVHTGAIPELQHWTDPPTGEVPFILPDREPSQGEEMAAWQALGSRGLRWRDEASDWDDLDDVSQLRGDEPGLGALDTTRTEHSDMFSFDEQFERLEDERSGVVPAVEPVVSEAPSPPAGRRPSPRRSEPPRPRPPRGGGGRGASSGRDLPTATVVGVGLIVALGIAYFLGSAVLMLFVTAIVTASALELYNLIQHRGFRPATLLGVCATVAVMLSAYWRGEVSVPLILALVFITSMLWYMLGVVDARPVVNVGLTVMTFVWIGVFGSYASLLLRVPHGKQLLLLPILVTVAADIGAYFAGSSIGSRPLAASISPGKTWEGVIGGGVAAILVSFILSRLPFLSKTWTGKHALLLGLVVAVVGPIGDLCESMVKRDLDLKDSGSFLPGHGGLLDRFDALLFVLPATYYLALYLKLG
jgi:CDP-diglyceride synthetase